MYASRGLRRSPGFALAAIASIAIGIAANTTIFSVASAVLLHTLPVEEPSRLVSVFPAGKGDCCGEFSYPTFADVRDQATMFSSVSAYFPLLPLSFGGRGQGERMWGQGVDWRWFETAGVRMYLGRGFRLEEDQSPGGQPVAVLSYGLWQRRFGADRNVVGQTFLLNSRPFTVVGVAPAGFRGVDVILMPEVWVPQATTDVLMVNLPPRNERDAQWLQVIARLKPGVSHEEARAGLAVIADRLNQAYPKSYDKLQFRLQSASDLHMGFKSAVQMFLGALMVVVFLVLLIACANVANLLLARATARQKELAVRLALGASRAALLRQMMIESLLLAVVGGLVGVLLSVFSTQALASFRLPMPLPIDLNLSLDGKVMLYTFGLALLTAFFFGFAPAWLASRTQMTGALKGEESAGGRTRRFGLRNVLVVAQVSLSLILLIGTGLFLRSLQKASSIDIGFRSQSILMLGVDPLLQGYKPERSQQFLDQAEERVRALPGVQSAAWTDIVPLSIGGNSTGFDVPGRQKAEDGRRHADVRTVSEGYFDTLGIPVIRGRSFGSAPPPHAILINEALAARQFTGEDPVGQRLRFRDATWEIIGVVRNAKSRTLGEAQRQEIFRLLRQNASGEGLFLGYTLLVAGGGTETLAPAVRREIANIDPAMVVFDQRTMEQHLENALVLPRMAATLFGVFGGAGLLLAAVGLYGVMSYSVSRRTREIGIRMALGSSSSSVLGMVLRQGFTLAAVAMALGLAVSLALARLASAILYGVKPIDPITFIGVPLFLAGVVLLATGIPARRAARVEPLRALHYE